MSYSNHLRTLSDEELEKERRRVTDNLYHSRGMGMMEEGYAQANMESVENEIKRRKDGGV